MLYHPKMGKLLAKEGNVTKVPVHTYGERERERERPNGSNNGLMYEHKDNIIHFI